MLFKLGTSLTQQCDELEAPALERVAALAVRALEQVRLLIGGEPSPSLAMRLSEALAKALLAAGRPGDAAVHAGTAWENALRAGAAEEALAEIRALQERCTTAASSRPTTQRRVICDGDTCQLADP